MPTTTISSDINSTDLVAIDLVPDEDLVIQQGVTVTTTGGNPNGGIGVQSSSGQHLVTVAGTARATTGLLWDNAFGALTVTSTGVVTGVESGEIEGVGVYVRGSATGQFNFTNLGLVTGSATGLAAIFDGRFAGSNDGTIRSSTGDAVTIGAANGGIFTNNGLIETTSTVSNAVDLFFTGSGGDVVQFVNNGTIRTAGTYALDMDSNDANRAFNFGTMDGGVLMGSQNDFLRQAGTLNGDVELGDGNDRYSGGTGFTNGTVNAGAGDDFVIGGASADVLQGANGNDWIRGNNQRDTIYGGNGNDTLRGDAFNDLLGGGAGNDEMRGGSGSDLMFGGNNNDLMFGQSGKDTLDGGAGNDTLSGGSFQDTLSGGAGNDQLDGGDARDKLTGGFGQDVLTGGLGRDTFIWNSASESGSLAFSDRITDFGFQAELLDLSAIAGPEMDFRWRQAFTASGNGEVRFYETTEGNSVVVADVDGNGTGDLFIRLDGMGLTADNFIL